MKNRATLAVALLALVVAASGTAVAANRYLITSTKQIKPSVMKAIIGRLPVSPLEYLEGPTTVVPPGEVGAARSECPSYSHAISAGGTGSVAGIDAMGIAPGGTFIIIANTTSIPLEIKALAVCAPVGGAVVSSHSHALAQREAAALARIRRER